MMVFLRAQRSYGSRRRESGQVGGGASMEKVQSIVSDEEKKRTNIIYAYYVLDRVLGSFMYIAYVTSTNV